MIDKQNTLPMQKIKRTKDGNAYLVTTTPLITNNSGDIQWQLSFEGGGWNTVWARTEAKAWKAAKKEFKEMKISSIFPATVSSIDSAMRSFY